MIQGDKIDFLIGGGDFQEQTCLNLLVADTKGRFTKVRNATGERNMKLVRRGWDVTEHRGKQAYFQILDYAPVEPWGYFAAPRYPEDDFGFILLDDIRQTDADGNRVCEEYDREHNFDFESARSSQNEVSTGKPEKIDELSFRQSFEIANAGTLNCEIEIDVEGEVHQINQRWSYAGEPVGGVKLEMKIRTPIGPETCQYSLHPGLVYNGNQTAEACHYLGEDFPEDTSTLPAGFSIEDDAFVVGGWAEPQKNRQDPMVSVRIEATGKRYEVTYLVPDSAQFGRRMLLDSDKRFTVSEGWELSKRFFIYQGGKRPGKRLSNRNQGYGQVILASWRRLYPLSHTNPSHTLRTDFDLRLKTTLDHHSLIQEIERGGRTYRMFFLARWLLGDDFDFSKEEFVPKKYFHAYTGFSWSGMVGLAAYVAFRHHLQTGDDEAYRISEDTLDFFADHAMSPTGILYPVYHENLFGIVDEFGTYFDAGNIDMGPLGEGLYWYVQCYHLLKENGLAEKNGWLTVVRSSLDSIMKLFPDADVPSRIDGSTGEEGVRRITISYWTESEFTKNESRPADVRFIKPTQRGATNFIYLIWSYVRFFQETGEKRYLNYGEKLGGLAIRIMEQYNIFAGSEADFYNIDKRQGHALMMAFLLLYEATDEDRWLEACGYAANWFSTWQHGFNICFDGLEHLPLGRFDYRTIGGTPVDIKYSTNNLAYAPGAATFLQLWRHTGETVWFERARALLHQGTQSTLTEEKRKWLNENYQGNTTLWVVQPYNPNGRFDAHCLGGGTEDVLPGWPRKGNWTSKKVGILSMYMLAMGLDVAELLELYGSISIDWDRGWSGAIDTLDQVEVEWRDRSAVLTARNMIASDADYTIRILGTEIPTIRLDGNLLTEEHLKSGYPLSFLPNQTRSFTLTW